MESFTFPFTFFLTLSEDCTADLERSSLSQELFLLLLFLPLLPLSSLSFSITLSCLSASSLFRFLFHIRTMTAAGPTTTLLSLNQGQSNTIKIKTLDLIQQRIEYPQTSEVTMGNSFPAVSVTFFINSMRYQDDIFGLGSYKSHFDTFVHQGHLETRAGNNSSIAFQF